MSTHGNTEPVRDTPLVSHLAASAPLKWASVAVFGGLAGLLSVFALYGVLGLGYPPTAPYILSTAAQILIALTAVVLALRGSVVGAMQLFVAGLYLTLIVEPYIVETETLAFTLFLMPAGVAALLVLAGLIYRRSVVTGATVVGAVNTVLVFTLMEGEPGVEELPLVTVMPLLAIIIVAAGVSTLFWDRLAAMLIRSAQEEADTARRLAAERETLVRESSHRVKNNLQVISSMLDLQAREIDDERTRDVLADARNRVSAMAVVHQSLHEAGRLDRVNIRVFLEELVSQLIAGFAGTDGYVRHATEAADAEMEPRHLVPLGLVVNELVTNAFQHGLREVGTDRARLRVSLRRASEGSAYVLEVVDNGAGLPDGFSVEGGESLGLALVRTLVRDQLGGSFDLRSTEETRAVVRLPAGLFAE
jgi:two-component sensor histidine kinase